jgi:hypothetical protein
MKHLKQAGLAAVMALVLVACVGASSASATTICVGGTITGPCTDGHPGGAVALTSTNSSLLVHGASSINCTHSAITGTAPATTATTLTIPVTLEYSSCTAFGVAGATVTVPANCRVGGANAVTLSVMWNQATAPQATASVTIPTGCTITVNVPLITCTVTISGHQTINGITITNGNSTTATSAELESALLSSAVVHPGGGFGCPTAGAHTGTLLGTYLVSSPSAAPGVTVIQ